MSDTLTPAYAVVHRAAQPAATVTKTVSMETISEVADAIPALVDWLAARGQAPSGPAFLRYLVIDMVHVGPYDGLYGATGDLLAHAGRHGLHFDHHPSEAGDVWISRLEWYESNPLEEPDPARWVTRLELRLADG